MNVAAPTILSSFLLMLACGLLGCGAPDPMSAGADAGPGPDAGDVPDPSVYEGIGDLCGTGCIGSDICANESDTCSTGYCLFDGRDDGRGEAYCTADCSEIGCPEGYSCLDVPFSLPRACVADDAVCGDGVVQRGEQCDDGNTESDDGCRGDCRQIDTPLDEQWHATFTASVRGTYVPPDAEEAEPFEVTVSGAAEMGSSGDACDVEVATIVSGNQYYRYYIAGCSEDGFVSVATDMVASSEDPPRTCVRVRLPHPAGPIMGPNNVTLSRDVTFCSGQSGVQWSQVTTSDNGDGTSDVVSRFTSTNVKTEETGPWAGCNGLSPSYNCPDIVGDVELELDLEVANQPE